MRNAWQEWHKDECRVLRERPGISPTALLVHRLIFWQRRKRLSVGELTCLQRLGGNFEEWVKEPIQAKRLQDEAVDIWKTAGGEEPLSLPWRLLRVVGFFFSFLFLFFLFFFLSPFFCLLRLTLMAHRS